MKNLHSSYLAALTSELCTLAKCWLITKANGDKLGFTDLDRALTFCGTTYHAYCGFLPSNVDSDLSMNPNLVTLQSFFSDLITVTDVITGQFDGAKVQLFRVNYLDLPTDLNANPPKHEILIDGFIKKITNSDQSFKMELAGLPYYLDNQDSWLTSPQCRNDFCDAKCTLNIEDYTDNLAVAVSVNNQFFYISNSVATDFYTGGKLLWTSGLNAGIETMVIQSGGSDIGLADPMPYVPQVGDDFELQQNCQKTEADCARRNNLINFQGEPNLPGEDQYGASKTDG